VNQVCERWIYSTCLGFALDVQEQQRTGFHYQYSIYQVEYSRNLLFHRCSQLEQVFQRMVDRTRARLDVPQVRTLFGTKRHPHWRWKRRPRLEVVLETPVFMDIRRAVPDISQRMLTVTLRHLESDASSSALRTQPSP